MIRNALAPAITSTLALSALATAQAAQAQDLGPCVAAEDAADAVIYAMPSAYDAALKTCGNRIAPDSFLRSTRGKAFIDGFRAQQDARWEGTFRFFKVFIEQETKGDDTAAQMIAAMPAESLRPFVDAMLGEAIGQEIKPDTCAKIDRGVALLSPLPVENVGGLVAFILEQVDLENPRMCNASDPAPATTDATTGASDKAAGQ